MNVVDSSGWLEYFVDGPGSDIYAPVVEAMDELIVPQICLLEVARVVLRERGEHAALQALAVMEQGEVIALSTSLMLQAAHLGVLHKLPLADSVILATARAHAAVLWTQDSDFKGLDGVRYFPKQK
jgi:predicted nucleic acid-binding protein